MSLVFLFLLSIYWHSGLGHCIDVFFGSTTKMGTPNTSLALYSMHFQSSSKDHLWWCLPRCECLILTVILECIFFRSSKPIPLVVPLAFSTIFLDITWLTSFLKKRRSLPDNFLNFLFALLVPRCCNLDLGHAYRFLICSTLLPSNIWLSLSVATFSIPISTPRTSTTWSYCDSSAAASTTIR